MPESRLGPARGSLAAAPTGPLSWTTTPRRFCHERSAPDGVDLELSEKGDLPMTNAASGWVHEPRPGHPPRLTVYEPRPGPIWVASLPDWRKRLTIAGAVAAIPIAAWLGHRSGQYPHHPHLEGQGRQAGEAALRVLPPLPGGPSGSVSGESRPGPEAGSSLGPTPSLPCKQGPCDGGIPCKQVFRQPCRRPLEAPRIGERSD